jgi:hypothetical protein
MSITDLVKQNAPGVPDGPAFVLDILGPSFHNANITNARWTFKGEFGWLNYNLGTFGSIVDRYRWEAGCIVEHVCLFVSLEFRFPSFASSPSLMGSVAANANRIF